MEATANQGAAICNRRCFDAAVWRAPLLEKRAALPLLHRSLVFSQSLLLHRDDSRNSVAIDADLEVHGHGAVDPFATSRILDVVIVLEAGGVTVVLRFLGEPDVAANRGAPRWPTRVIRFDVAPDRVDRFPAF